MRLERAGVRRPCIVWAVLTNPGASFVKLTMLHAQFQIVPASHSYGARESWRIVSEISPYGCRSHAPGTGPSRSVQWGWLSGRLFSKPR